MANTYTLINSTTLSTTAASVTFSSIPATYNDLCVLISAREDSTAFAYPRQLRIRINNDSTTIYSYTSITGQDQIAGANQSNGNNGALVYAANSNNASSTANTFGSAEIYIPAYLTTQNRPIMANAVTENNSVNYATIDNTANLYTNTTAITSLTFLISGYNFVSGSTFWLYGIKNS